MSVVAHRKRHATPGVAKREAQQVPTPELRAVEAAAARLVDVAAKDADRASSLAPIMRALATAAEVLSLDPLITALEQPEVLAELRAVDPLAPARLRGVRAKQRLLAAEGGVVTGQEFADLVGVSRQAIDKRRRNGALIGLRLGKKGYAYPVWQAEVEGMPQVLAELREYEPWTQASFMLSANAWLGGETPLAMLRRGELQDVVTAASMYGEQTATTILPERPHA